MINEPQSAAPSDDGDNGDGKIKEPVTTETAQQIDKKITANQIQANAANQAYSLSAIIQCRYHIWRWRRSQREKAKWTDMAIVILTGGIVFFAFAQWHEMNSAGHQTDRIIAADERLAKAMEDSVTQAGSVLTANIETARTDQRAWLAFEDVRGTASLTDPNLFSANLKNTGKTPAINVYVRYFLKNVPRGEQLTFTYKEPPEPSRGVLAPNGVRYVFVPEPAISIEEFNRIRTAEKRVYLYGEATYDDIFARHHWITFCAYLTIEAVGTAMTYCSEHNETDQQNQ